MSLTHTHTLKTTDQQGLRHRDYRGPLGNLIIDAEEICWSSENLKGFKLEAFGGIRQQ